MAPRLTEVFLIREAQAVVPFVKLKVWLEEAIPVFVWRYMIDRHQVKICGYMSHAFGYVSKQRGIPMVIVSKPGHFVNAVLTDRGWVEVDMTHIQFETAQEANRFADTEDDEKDPWGERRAIKQAVARMTKDPQTAVKIEMLSSEPHSTVEPDPTEMNYESAREDAIEFFGGTLPKARIDL